MFSKKKKRVEISAPSNFEHRVHTGYDPSEQRFTGLPRQWQGLLEESARRPKPLVDPACITAIRGAHKVGKPREPGGSWGQRSGFGVLEEVTGCWVICGVEFGAVWGSWNGVEDVTGCWVLFGVEFGAVWGSWNEGILGLWSRSGDASHSKSQTGRDLGVREVGGGSWAPHAFPISQKDKLGELWTRGFGDHGGRWGLIQSLGWVWGNLGSCSI